MERLVIEFSGSEIKCMIFKDLEQIGDNIIICKQSEKSVKSNNNTNNNSQKKFIGKDRSDKEYKITFSKEEGRLSSIEIKSINNSKIFDFNFTRPSQQIFVFQSGGHKIKRNVVFSQCSPDIFKALGINNPEQLTERELSDLPFTYYRPIKEAELEVIACTSMLKQKKELHIDYPLLIVNGGSTTIQFVQINSSGEEEYEYIKHNNSASISYTDLENFEKNTGEIKAKIEECGTIMFGSNFGFLMLTYPFEISKFTLADGQISIENEQGKPVEKYFKDFKNCGGDGKIERNIRCNNKESPPTCCRTTILDKQWDSFNAFFTELFENDTLFQGKTLYVFKKINGEEPNAAKGIIGTANNSSGRKSVKELIEIFSVKGGKRKKYSRKKNKRNKRNKKNKRNKRSKRKSRK